MSYTHERVGSLPTLPTKKYKCESSSVGRAPAFQAGCREFESRLSLQNVDKGCVCHNNLCKGEYTLSRSRITANTVHFQCTDEVSTTFSCTNELQNSYKGITPAYHVGDEGSSPSFCS